MLARPPATVTLSRPGPLLEEGEQRRVIPTTPSLSLQHPEHLVHKRRDGERHPVLPARRKSYPQVLAVVLDLAPGGEVVRQELLALDLQDFVGRDAHREHLYDPTGRHPGLRA